ncbi:MAG: hypothetical protein M3040_02920, partial [Bacteroidota bacterium]|nr:hypothetical protein [Bacteroidota bacterium]
LPLPQLFSARLLDAEPVMSVVPEPDIPLEELLIVAVPEVFEDVEPNIAELLTPTPEALAEAEPETPVLVPEVAVEAEALIPELADVPVVLCVLLQFASRTANGNTKNIFFITSLFVISTPHQNSAKNERKC